MVPDNTSPLETTYMGGGAFAALPPVFKEDGSTLFIAWKNRIYGYNCKTGRKVQVFQGLNENIVGFGSTFKNGEECLIACSKLGNICVWKVENTAKLSENSLLYKNIKSFKSVPDRKGNKNKAIIVFSHSIEGSVQSILDNETSKIDSSLTIGFVDIKKNTVQIIPIKMKKSGRIEQKYYFDVGEVENGGMFLVFSQGRYLYYVDLNRDGKGTFFIRPHIIALPKYYTALHTLHTPSPTPNCLAGDSLGRIILYTDLRNIRPLHTTLHWHTLPVRAMATSRAGTRLYSGGEEAVLVKWATLGYGGQAGGRNQMGFVPRLGGTVTWIGVGGEDGRIVAVNIEGQGVRLMTDGEEEDVWVRGELSLGSNLSIGLVYDKRSNCIILNGISGNVQFYSISDGTFLYSMDVVRHNRLPNERNKTMVNIQVQHVAVNENGSWYATVEERVETDSIYELRLKFWKFDSVTQKFHLNTSIEYPHELSISGIKFRPNRKEAKLDQCVTISKDGLFKNWHLVEIMGVDGALSTTWRCATTADYKRPFRAACLSFSQDGSVLALGYGAAITIWLPDTCQLKRCLTDINSLKEQSKRVDFIKSVAFGRGRCSYLIVAITKKLLTVWNLLSYTLTLRVEMDITDLIPDPSSCIMAVLRKNNSVYFFEPDQLGPLQEFEIQEKKSIKHCTFVPQDEAKGKFDNKNTRIKSQFFYLNSKKELHCLGAGIKTQENTNDILQIESSNFSRLLAEKLTRTLKIQENRKIIHDNPNKKSELKRLLDTPNHTQIPLSLLACSFLHSLVLNEQTSSEHKNSDNSTEVVTNSNKILVEYNSEREINGDHKNGTDPNSAAFINLNKLKIKDKDWVKIL